MAILDKIKALTKQLLPTGRAFKMPINGEFQKLRDGLAESEKRVYDDARLILDSLLPDNDNFTVDDAASDERRFGLVTNIAVPLAVRKLAILRKIAHPGDIKARQHHLYIQGQLQDAGFNVYVFENIFPGPTRKTALQVGIDGNGSAEHGVYQHGEIEHGDYLRGSKISRIANKIEETEADYNIAHTSNIFFIGGSPVGTFTSVDSDRKDEFRDLISKLKPRHLIAYLYIDYV